MIDKQISALINVLRYSENITPLQKDILDTWHELKRVHSTKNLRASKLFQTILTIRIFSLSFKFCRALFKGRLMR